MWNALQELSRQITKYSTFFGQIWYMSVFLFRLIVVITIGGPVYGDEQGMFKCSTQAVGCLNQCFNEFSKISHIRFWAFQLLAVVTPTIFFHFYSTYVSGEVAKVESIEKDIEAAEKDHKDLTISKKYYDKYKRRKKQLGKVRRRKYVSGTKLEEIPVTKKIHFAYFGSVIGRIITEGVFMYLGYDLFANMDHEVQQGYNPMEFLWFRVPPEYKCEGKGVEAACNQHFNLGDGGYVPCYVSRAWEKTIFLRYMNILSAICFVLSCVELIYLIGRGIFVQKKKVTRRAQMERNEHEIEESAAQNNGYESGTVTRLHKDAKGKVIKMTEIEAPNKRGGNYKWHPS